MLEEDSTPMTAYATGPEKVRLGREMDEDEGKNIQRHAIDVGQGAPPLADVYQHRRKIPVELRNIFEGETAEKVSVSPLKTSPMIHDNIP